MESCGCDVGVREVHLHDVLGLSEAQVSQRVETAKAWCQSQGVRFTQLRQQVYTLILQAKKPLGAYDLVALLQALRVQKSADQSLDKLSYVAPPTIYRSLEFLLQAGLIHQLASLNAYVPCCHPRSQHVAAFLICEVCQRVQECGSVPTDEVVDFATQVAGFKVLHSVVELSGVCQTCQSASA